MQTKPTSDITVKERLRKKIISVDVDVLAKEIAEKGLFHAILLDNDHSSLIAGEHRLKAITQLHEEGTPVIYNGELIPSGHIPYTVIGDLSDLQIREAELTENDVRVQLSWAERSAAIAALHELREEQAILSGEKHTKSDTSEEVYGNKFHAGDVTHDLLIAKHLDDEDVAKAGSRKDAVKVIKKKLQKEHREKLAETYKDNPTSSQHELINDDMMKVLPKLPDNTFELIISDPPYGIGADTFKNQNAVKHSYKDDADYADTIIRCIATEGFRVCKAKAHLYMFHDVRRFPTIVEMFKEAGWYVWPWPLIWYKGTTNGLLPRPDHGPRRSYEAILYAIKGDKTTQVVASDVLYVQHDRSVERGAHKPVDLYKDLIRRSCLPGSRVLDPTAGTAPILTAATQTNTIATAIEIEKAAFGQAMERLREPTKPDTDPLDDFLEEDDD